MTDTGTATANDDTTAWLALMGALVVARVLRKRWHKAVVLAAGLGWFYRRLLVP